MLDKLIGGAWSYVVAGLLAFAAVAGIFAAGWNARDAKCDAAALRVKLAAVTLDLEAANAAAVKAATLAAAAEKESDALQLKVDDYAKSLSSRPRVGACALTPDDARRLRGIR